MKFAEFLLLGVGVGGAYAINALGIVLIYRASRVVNFAQSGVLAVGAYTFYGLATHGLDRPLAVLLGVFASVLVGALIYVLVLRPLRGATDLMRLVAILGAFLVIENALLTIVGAAPRTAPAVLPSRTWHLGSNIAVGSDRIYLVVLSIAITLILVAVARWTRFGLYSRAVAENETAFRGRGHSADRVSLINWCIGGGLAGLSGILLASVIGLDPSQLDAILLPTLAAALVGRFYSFAQTLIAALLIGIASSEMTAYFPTSDLSESVGLIVIVGFLILSGRGLPGRDEISARMPTVGNGRVRLLVTIPAVIIGIVLIGRLSSPWDNAVAITCATALVYLSVVVITGYAGQLSLGQFAVAGSGALLAGKLSSSAGLPLLLTLLVTLVVMLPVGILLGLPSFRTRGMNLAISTLAIGFVVNESLLSNPWATGGTSGVVTRSPEVMGFSVDPIVHPSRYAIFAFCLVILGVLAVAGLRRSYVGRRWLAIRANERAAAGVGVNVMWTKASALGVSAALAAAGGVLFAFSGPIVIFTGYGTDLSIDAIVFTVIGGIGYSLGAINGALAATGGVVSLLLSQYLGIGSEIFAMVAGVGVIFNAIRLPSGFLDVLRQRAQRWAPQPTEGRPVQVKSGRRRVESGSGVGLEVRNVSIRFGGIIALQHVSLSVPRSSVVGLIGPNGAGKTTLIDCLSGFANAYEGNIALAGQSLDGRSPAARAKAGLSRAFQGIEMFNDLSLYDNFRVATEASRRSAALRVRRGAGRALSVSSECVDAIGAFGLMEYLDRLPTELSYGLRRLASIARAVADSPRFLLLDEPAAGLSITERDVLARFLRRVAVDYEVGVLLVEHDVPLVLSVSDRVVALDHGEVVVSGSPDLVRRDQRVRDSYLGVEAEEHGVPEVLGEREEVK
jgi:ABC-type branched-subunit amino acid transport system ATPase component/ABC-type branched-subunit amino acid transport system permease subunit